MFLAEDCKVVNLLPPKDTSSSAHAAAYVSMKEYDHVDLVITMGATGAIGSSVAVDLKQAKDTSGTSVANLAVGAYYKNAAALGSSSTANDTYVRTTVASSAASFKLVASTNNVTYIIPVDAAKLNAASSMDAVGIAIDAAGAATLCGCVAILSNSRYKSSNPPSAL